MASRRFWLLLVGLVAAGLAVRLTVVLGMGPEAIDGHGDALRYHAVANHVAEHFTFAIPVSDGYEAVDVHAGQDPPLFVVALGVSSLLGAEGVQAHQLVGVLIGTVSVVLIALLARRLGGDRSGLVAAVLATIYPAAWIHEPLLLAESLVVCLVAASLLAVYRLRERPSAGRAAALGACTALAALTRSELILLVPLLVLPSVFTMPVGRRQQACALGAALLAATVLVGPWVGYNLARFEEPTLLSTQAGFTLAGANCHQTYSGREVGSFSYSCAFRPTGLPPTHDRSVADALLRRRAFGFMGDHLAEVPLVAPVRVLRMLDMWAPVTGIDEDETLENRPRSVAWIALLLWYPLGFAAVVAVPVLRRRGQIVWPLLTVVGLCLAAAAAFYGSVRFRAGMDVVVLVLAAVAADAAWETWRARRASTAPVRTQSPEEDAPVPGRLMSVAE